MQIIGILDSASPASRGEELAAFHHGLRLAGVGGKDAMILYGWADNDYGRLPELARNLVDSRVSVIVAAGGPVSAIEAKKATAQIPIVFTTITDPAKSGLVENFDRPEGNLTGTYGWTTELDEVRLKILGDVARPGAIGILANPDRPYPLQPDFNRQKSDLEAKARAVGRAAVVLGAHSDADLDAAFTQFNGQVTGLLVTADPFFNSRRERVIALAARLAVPAIYQWPGFAASGGLMSYGPSKAEGYRNAGEYAGRIVKGERPAALPVRQTKAFELALNSITARSLGIERSSADFAKIVADLRNPVVNVI
jgi:putative ABC transport system substrate-binding protein